MIPIVLLAALLVSAAPAPGAAPVVTATALPGADGGTEELQPADVRATVLVFFRPEHERSQAMLADVARCQERLGAKPVRWLGVLPDGAATASAHADVAAAGVALPLAIDRGDRVYGQLGLRMRPVAVVLEGGRRLSAVEPFHAVTACELLTARVRRALGEITDADVAAAASPPRSDLPGDGDQNLVARRNLHLGEKLLLARSFAKAHEQARKALEVAPIADAWALEGEIFVAEGRCPEAKRALASALALQPGHPRASAARARCK